MLRGEIARGEGGLLLCRPPAALTYRGRENFARGEFRRENFAVKNGGEIFPWRNFWQNSSILCHRGRGIVFPKKSQALTNAPEPTVCCADVWNLVLLIR